MAFSRKQFLNSSKSFHYLLFMYAPLRAPFRIRDSYHGWTSNGAPILNFRCQLVFELNLPPLKFFTVTRGSPSLAINWHFILFHRWVR